MLPRWHIILGLLFSLALWAFFPDVPWYCISIMFLSSILIDFDHYMCAVWKTGNWGLRAALKYHEEKRKVELLERRRGIFRKEDFHIFHTIEFHAIVLALAFVYPVFMYVLAGMIFHSLSDLVNMAYEQEITKREFFFANWIRIQLNKKREHRVKQIERIKVTLN